MAEQSKEDIERELKEFEEEEERERLNLVSRPVQQWRDESCPRFERADRESTTILTGGLTVAQDVMVEAALEGLGYQVEVLSCPEVDAMYLGKEFGSRAQCNPTYFTVGSLLKRLISLRDDEGLSIEDINRQYVFLTAGACGPCRFGTYSTEFRKALRDSGFEGFRVLLFQQQGGLKQASGFGGGLEFTPRFFFQLMKAFIAGDLLNALGYRIRPYEVSAGTTDRVMGECREMICDSLRHRRSLWFTLRRCRRKLNRIEIDRLQVKPKVIVIGEFWAMTTEGGGNYHLQRFLESEGAEVEVQFLTSWLLYLLWQNRHDVKRRMNLRGTDYRSKGLAGRVPGFELIRFRAAEYALRFAFRELARAIGLERYTLPDMDRMARQAQPYYNVELRGGEGHLEVGKVIDSVTGRKCHMIVSVKPFGCLPSSGVSDGIQSTVVSDHPEAIFCPVETTGDGDVNFQSRVLMHLFRARIKASEEFETALKTRGITLEEARQRLSEVPRGSCDYPPHQWAGFSANTVASL